MGCWVNCLRPMYKLSLEKNKATIINRVLSIAGVFTYYPVPTCFVYETLIVMHVITVI